MQNELHLTDLIDVEILQQIQDAFSDMTGMAALTADKNGVAVTKGSNFTDFCAKYTRLSPLGEKLCFECDKKGAEKTLANGCPCSYYCHAGLVDYAAPIMADGKLVGSFIGGQVLSIPPDLEKTAEIAQKLGINPDEYKDAIKRVKIVSKETIDKSAHFLYVVANVLSDIAYKSYCLHRVNLEVEKASHMKSDFLANMSHEIRTPMNAVIGLADLALREEMSPAAREFIHQIKASGRNLLVIINDILDFSKIESGKLDIIEVMYEPLSVINDLASIINSRIGSKNIEFTMDIAPDLPQNLFGDNVRIHQIILNLLTNAVKFTQEGEVHLKMEWARNSEDTITMKVAVSDTGIGIKKNDLSKLFNSFQQVDSKRNRNIEGTGLGLAISKQLLNLMNGTISVKSEYNKGSTFFFDLPQKIVKIDPCIPKVDRSVTAAILISNVFVKRQLLKDLSWIGAKNIDLENDTSLDSLTIDYLIIERAYFSQSIREFLINKSNVICLVINDYDSYENIDLPNVHIIRKPVYSLSLYNAMGIANVSLGQDNSELEFTFEAPSAYILIVDDNSINLTVAKGLLEPLNMNIDVAKSAGEAIEKIHENKYDLIFMDHMMPEVDGVEATHIIRRMIPSYKDVPIIALTANAIGGAKEMFIKEGMNDFVAKPIDIRDILASLRKWLPQEKIIPIEKSAAEKKLRNKKHKEIEIKELNTKAALTLLGSEDLFWSVLKEYFYSIDRKAQTIRAHWQEQRIRDYTIEVHSLKSTSKQIGAEELSKLAAEMEHAGNDGNIRLINEKTESMLEMLCEYKGILAPFFKDDAEVNISQADKSDNLSDMLEQLILALESFDTLQVDEAVEKISEYTYPDEQSVYFKSLKESVQDCDIDRCLEIIAEWKACAGI